MFISQYHFCIFRKLNDNAVILEKQGYGNQHEYKEPVQNVS
jgi:hypothetical protein